MSEMCFDDFNYDTIVCRKCGQQHEYDETHICENDLPEKKERSITLTEKDLIVLRTGYLSGAKNIKDEIESAKKMGVVEFINNLMTMLKDIDG